MPFTSDNGDMKVWEDYWLSLRRTLVPVVVAFLLVQGAKVGFDFPVEELTAVVTVVLAGVYYALARFFEMKAPWVGILLGAIRQPHYEDPRKPQLPPDDEHEVSDGA